MKYAVLCAALTLQDMTNNVSTFPTGSASSAASMAAEVPAALPATGVDHSLPTLPLATTIGGLLLLVVGITVRSYLSTR